MIDKALQRLLQRHGLSRLGIRFWVVPDRFQIDATRGDQTGTGNRQFYTVGLRFLF